MRRERALLREQVEQVLLATHSADEMAVLIQHSITNGVAAATLARADLHSAFNEVMIAEITEARRSGCVPASAGCRLRTCSL